MNKKSFLKDSEVRWDDAEQRPRMIRGKIQVKQKTKPEDTARAFLDENKDTFKLSSDKKDLKLMKDSESPMGRHLRFQQYIDDIPVFGGQVLVHFDKQGNIRQLNNNHELASRVMPDTGDARITPKTAEKNVRDAIDGPIKIRKKGKVTCDLMHYPTADGLRLCYCIVIPTASPTHDWRAFVDAFSGEIITLEDIIQFMAVDGEGLVFDSNPVVTANDNTFRDGVTAEATLNAERVTRTLKDLNNAVGGVYSLIGPYCEITNLADPSTGIPQEANADDFKYERTDINFEAVNIYYHIDTLQRYIQDTLGITNANNRTVDADPHDNTITAAWYSPATKDLHFSDSGAGRADRGEDGDCMAHEYGHAIQDNMVPGWGDPVIGTSRYESRAIGEGFADILAVLLFVMAGNGYQRQVMEDWVFVDQDLGDGLRGLRRVDHTKKYSTFTTGYDFYSNSEIWSGSLWDIFLSMGGDSATVADWEEPRDILLKALIASHDLLTTRASMPEAAEALMTTHEKFEDQCGRHLVEMIDAFHDHEVLECVAGSDLKITKLWSQPDNLSVRSREPVEFGQDNWFYAEITNSGSTARAAVINFNFKSPFSTPIYPTDFRDNIISAAAEFNIAAASTITVEARWPKEYIPAIPAGQEKLHGCILAEVYNPVDHVPAGVTYIGASNGKLKQCNTDVVDLLPDEAADFRFVMSNFHIMKKELVRLEVIRPPKWEDMEILINHHDPQLLKHLWESMEVIKQEYVQPFERIAAGYPEISILEPTKVTVGGAAGSNVIFNLARGSSLMIPRLMDAPAGSGDMIDDDFVRRDANLVEIEKVPYLRLLSGARVGLPYYMIPRQRLNMNVRIRAPRNAKPGEKFKVEFVQRNARGEYIGGFDILVRIVDKK